VETSIAIDGVGVGHWTDAEARTGCTVVLLPADNVTSGEVRGGAPATREFALLEPGRSVVSVDAVVLSGGSAFGLAAGAGVADSLEPDGRGFETSYGNIPIVVGLSLYDLGVGRSDVRPTAVDGAAALADARHNIGGPIEAGRVGAGTGATVGKWLGLDNRQSAGLGVGRVEDGDLFVVAIVALNALGDVDDGGGAERFALDPAVLAVPDTERENTTIGVVITNTGLDKTGCNVLAQGAHDGLARAVFPSHTSSDGDGFVATSIGAQEAQPIRVRSMAVAAVERAIRSVELGTDV
jgi:L-aminopeptidase/D-esterase-like protein